jgi:hypothetical protein
MGFDPFAGFGEFAENKFSTSPCRSANAAEEPRSEKSDCGLQLRCNALIPLGLKAAQFTAKYLKHHVKRQALNHRVPGSSLGAPTLMVSAVPEF